VEHGLKSKQNNAKKRIQVNSLVILMPKIRKYYYILFRASLDMPLKISLDTVKSKLPLFVTIEENSYRGIRYNANFIDKDYNEPFVAIVAAVIKHQHGCKSRANNRRSKPYGKKLTLEDFRKLLPPYLSIYPESWRGLRYTAKFHDIEYNEDFEMYCFNLLREGKGYCPSRKLYEFRKKIMLSVETIQTRLDTIYGINNVILVPDSYKGTGKSALFSLKDGKFAKMTVDLALTGILLDGRGKRNIWRNTILHRDNYKCRITGETSNLDVHHIESKSTSPSLQYEINNGITFARKLHIEFHSRYGKKNNTLEQLKEFFILKGAKLE
jgi:hypothetical protein